MLQRVFAAAISLVLACNGAFAQSSPGWSYGYTPTAAQWNQAFASKQDALNFTPLNIAGGTMLGKLILAPSQSGFAGLNCGQGTAPSSPINGDMWCTSSGVYVFLNGQTIGPFQASGTPNFAALLPVQTVVAISKVFGAGDLYWQTRRSNSGSPMTDTLPPASAGMVNGTRLQVNNVDASASDTLSAGAGTSIGGSGVVGHGRSTEFVYDAPATTWRPTLNSTTALLGPNNLSDVSSVLTSRINLNIESLAAAGDANYTILSTNRMVYHSALTAARTDTLPAAASVNPGQAFVISDFLGLATASHTITLVPAGSDTINGASSVVAISAAYGAGLYFSDGVSHWTFLASATTSGTVTEQKNTVGPGLVTSGNCDNTTTNAGSPCNISLLFEPGTTSNCIIAASVASNALTVSLLTQSGATPSSTNACVVSFRNATAANGNYAAISVTAATTFSTGTSGSTFGSANATPFRIWVTAWNNAGTVVLGVSIQSGSGSILPLNEAAVQSSTACNGCTNATGLGTFYTTAAQTSEAIRILGYMDWSAGLTTAGTWASGPTTIQLMGPGVKKPGDIVQKVWAVSASQVTATSTTKVQAAPSVAIAPTSTINLISVFSGLTIEETGVVGCFGQISRSTTFTAPTTSNVGLSAGGVAGSFWNELALLAMDSPATTSSTTYVPFIWAGSSGTCVANPTLTGGTPSTFTSAEELMGWLEPANDNMLRQAA